MSYDVLIVGFGPVGATLANLLARRGVRAAVVDAERDVYDKPRAITFDHEAMRVFQACSLARRIEPYTAPHRGTHFLGLDGRVIKKFEPMAHPYPLTWAPTITFVQPELERVLREGVVESGKVDVFLEHRATRLEQDATAVALTVRDVAEGGERVLRGAYLVACDGANSFVRKRMGIPLEDLGFDEWWMVVDVRLHACVELPPRSIQYCWPSRPSTFVPGPGNLRRWEIKLLPGEDPEAFGAPDNVARQIGRFVDISRVEIWRSAVYRFHALLAEHWRDRRIFLAGDACHQTPPFLGQGMCAGIRDAANLAWKLDLVLRHGAPDALLDTYAAERKPHVRKLVAHAKEFGLIIGELDEAAARERDERLGGQLERGEAETVRQRFVPNLVCGVIDEAADACQAGTLFVQPRVVASTDRAGRPQLLDDLLGWRFLIATTTAEAQGWLHDEAIAAWRRIGGERVLLSPSGGAGTFGAVDRGVLCVEETGSLFSEWAAEHGVAAVVVRPDRYVFGAARDAHQLNRLVRAVVRQVI